MGSGPRADHRAPRAGPGSDHDHRLADPLRRSGHRRGSPRPRARRSGGASRWWPAWARCGWPAAHGPAVTAGPVLPIQLELSVDMLTAALRAAGLVKADATPQLVTPPLRDGHGWAVTLDLPRGGGKTAADAIAKRDTVAAELGVDEIQVIMSRVRAVAGGHAGRLMIWVADDDPYIGAPNPSPLTG